MGPDTAARRSACSYCGVGCGVTVHSTLDNSGARIVAKVVGDRLHPANGGRLCTKGGAHADLMAAPGRMTTAFQRTAPGTSPVPVPVDRAVAEAARRIRAIVDEHGPDAVALYVSGQMSLEAQYVANKLAKGYLRTAHIESNSRLCMASAGTGYKQSLGADGPPGSYSDIEQADLFFVIGANMADCHPILFLRMADRLRAGARLIVADPRRTATADKADLFLQLRPGTDLALLNGLLHLLVAGGHIDPEFIAAHTEGWESMPDFLATYTPEYVAGVTGLAASDIQVAADWIAAAGEWMTLWTMGLNQSTHGTWNTNAICNLHLATGAICRPGSGPFSLTGQPNAMGGREMGYMGPGLPGQRSALNAADREFTERAWELKPGTIRAEAGTGTIDMFAKMAAGEIKAAWIICTNPVASVANRSTVIAGLEAAELVITQDTYTETATNKYADLMLPATLWAEAEGVYVNSERTATLLQQSADPAGEARPDWQLICDIATALGFAGFGFKSAADIFEEIKVFANPQTGYDLRGIDYERLSAGPVQWPCPPAGNDRNPIRYLNDGVSQHLHIAADGSVPRLGFATASRRAVFWPRPHLDAAELPDDDFPFVLNTGRLQHQWHTMTKTGRIAKLRKLNPEPFIEIHPDDAQRLSISAGDQVEVVSRRGTATLPAAVTDRVRPGDCFAPFHWNDIQGESLAINAVTSDAVDPDSLQPEFKSCAVGLRRVAATASGAHPHPAAALLGVETPVAPALTAAEQTYLSGYLAALHSMPVTDAPVLPVTAPLAERTRLYVDGVLAGLYSRSDTPPSVAETGTGKPVLVMWASQTGNAEEVAAAAAARLGGAGFAPQTVNMDNVALDELTKARDVLVITSTFGDGGPPDNGADFWERVNKDAPRLNGMRYAVLALGDSAYADFCGYGRRVDEVFAKQGGTRLVSRVDCEPDFTAMAAQWLDAVVTALGGDAAGPAVPVPVAEPAAPALPFTRESPLLVPVSRNELLSGAGSAKEVRRFGFDLSGSGARYEAGDALAILPVNSPVAVADWLEVTGLDGEHVVTVGDREMPLADALHSHFDITKVSPDLLAFVAERNSDQRLAKLLRRDNRNELDGYLWDRQAPDLLRDFPVRTDVSDWQSVLKKLTPRQYSISSSPLADPREVQLTVGVVRYGLSGGVCSTFLADRSRAARVPVYLQRAAHFRPPIDPSAPMIMVGPGTGIAPFRAFLQHRQILGCRGRNWLFFGDQHAASDFYYRGELEDMFRDGFLTRLDVAFSRDQRERIYVQHRMIEHGAELWSWLQDGGHFYVCGDANRMARDVDEALSRIIQIHGHLDADAAHAYKKQLVTEKRYLRDVY